MSSSGRSASTSKSPPRLPSRQVVVAPERIVGWIAGCRSRHGELTWTSPGVGALRLTAADGFSADAEPFLARDKYPGSSGPVPVPVGVDGLSSWVGSDARLALLLVRRGGYAVGLAHGAELTAHKVGTRYVQSRTAAGGWSQQRFARRRDNQAGALVEAVRGHAVRVLFGGEQPVLPEALVVGGDRKLVEEVLVDRRLSRLAVLPRAGFFGLPDPRLDVLRRALAGARGIPIILTDPPSPG